MIKRINAPITEETIQTLKAGDTVLLSGVVYTARDAAHKRMCQALESGQKLPFSLEGAVIYYVGPTPAKPGQVIGIGGADDERAHGCVCAETHRAWAQRDDRKGAAREGGDRRHGRPWGCLFCGNWRRRCTFGEPNYEM